MFGSKCFVLNKEKDNLGKFDAKTDEDIFLGYSSHSHACRFYNKRTIIVEEFVHIVSDEANLELRDVYKNGVDVEDSSELLQGNNQLI